MIYTGRKGLEIYSANLAIKVGGLAHSSFLVLITCRDVSNECNYARPRSAPYGLCQDKTTIEGMYVAVKMKNPPFLRYEPINQVISTKYSMESTWYLYMSR